MKTKKFRIPIIIGAILLTLYTAFWITDCARLRNSKMYTKPLITLSESRDPQAGYMYYSGLGYKIRYSIRIPTQLDNGMTAIFEKGTSAEFSWLGVPIWGWWE